MTRPPNEGPRPTLLDQAFGWVVAGAAAGLVAVALVAIQVAGRTASLLTGHGWNGPGLVSADYFRALAEGPAGVWPDVPAGLVYGLLGVELVAVGTAVAVGLHRWSGWQAARRERMKDPAQYMATAVELAEITVDGLRSRTARLRSQTMGDRPPADMAPADVGVPIGIHRPVVRRRPVELRASWEDVMVSIMAPRSGKTTGLAIPAVLEAPGVVVATSNKADLWAATADLRHRDTGEEPFVFDPCGLSPVAQSWWWDPLEDITEYPQAENLARHFLVAGADLSGTDSVSRNAFFEGAGEAVLAALLLAAAVTPGRSLRDVWSWLNDQANPEPVHLLRQHGRVDTAIALESRQNLPHETSGGIWGNAVKAANCLQTKQVMDWVAPERPPGRRLDVGTLVKTPGATIFLMSKKGPGGVPALVSALTERLLSASSSYAEMQPHGRLDPPMVVVLDEAANICPIPDLPELMSHYGSRGIVTEVILQSRPQGRRVWGRDGMESMWNAATVKIIGSGISDAELLAELSTVIGNHEVRVSTTQHGRAGRDQQGPSWSSTSQDKPIMTPQQIAAMAKGTALVWPTGSRIGMVDLPRWFEGPRADEITAAIDHAHRPRALEVDPDDGEW